ncbi:hypothetical protein ACLKA6_017192 [Drosophila palustris]
MPRRVALKSGVQPSPAPLTAIISIIIVVQTEDTTLRDMILADSAAKFIGADYSRNHSISIFRQHLLLPHRSKLCNLAYFTVEIALHSNCTALVRHLSAVVAASQLHCNAIHTYT